MAARGTEFPRARRLTRAAEFSSVFGGADRSADRFFTVLAKATDAPMARIGLAISRRAAPRAVDRNRLRRLARESFRQLELAPLDFVVLARRDAVTATNAEVRRSLDRHFMRLSQTAYT